jgi:hypothetical protein
VSAIEAVVKLRLRHEPNGCGNGNLGLDDAGQPRDFHRQVRRAINALTPGAGVNRRASQLMQYQIVGINWARLQVKNLFYTPA